MVPVELHHGLEREVADHVTVEDEERVCGLREQVPGQGQGPSCGGEQVTITLGVGALDPGSAGPIQAGPHPFPALNPPPQGVSLLYGPVPKGSSSCDMEILIPSWKGEAGQVPPPTPDPREASGDDGRGQSRLKPHPLLLRLHFLLQHLRHVAHGQDHVVHAGLWDRRRRPQAG